MSSTSLTLPVPATGETFPEQCLYIKAKSPALLQEGGAFYVRRKLGQVEAVEVHHFRPGGGEVRDELVLGIVAGIHFGDGSQLGV